MSRIAFPGWLPFVYAISSAVVIVNVVEASIVTVADAIPSNGPVDLMVNFSGSSPDSIELYEWDFDTFQEDSKLIRRVRTVKAVKQDGKMLFHGQLEIFFESGVGLITGQGSDPQAMLQWSDDGGHTWSPEVWRSAGKIGAKNWRAVWNRLGSSRQRNPRLIVTDPVKWVITGSNLEVEVGTA